MRASAATAQKRFFLDVTAMMEAGCVESRPGSMTPWPNITHSSHTHTDLELLTSIRKRPGHQKQHSASNNFASISPLCSPRWNANLCQATICWISKCRCRSPYCRDMPALKRRLLTNFAFPIRNGGEQRKFLFREKAWLSSTIYIANLENDSGWKLCFSTDWTAHFENNLSPWSMSIWPNLAPSTYYTG